MNKYEKNPKKYAMSMDLQTTKHHPGYCAHCASTENVRRGRAQGRSYKHVAQELQLLANLEERRNPKASRRFKESAELARKRERKLVEV